MVTGGRSGTTTGMAIPTTIPTTIPTGTRTATRIPTPMTTEDADLLKLTHWLSPVFPIGSYAYSHGIEALVAEKHIHDTDTLQTYCSTLLKAGSGLSDAVLLIAAMQSEDASETQDWALALASSAERHQETMEQGAAFTSTHNALTGRDYPVSALPVAVGRAARDLSLPPSRVAAFYLQSMIANLVIGAIRHIPLGQSAGQAIIAALQPAILAAASRAKSMTPLDIFTSQPGADLAAMRHETQETRIFRT